MVARLLSEGQQMRNIREYVATIKEENLIHFHSLEEAQASWRKGCKNCKPEE
jgi:hypothetical protein